MKKNVFRFISNIFPFNGDVINAEYVRNEILKRAEFKNSNKAVKLVIQKVNNDIVSVGVFDEYNTLIRFENITGNMKQVKIRIGDIIYL